jgi:hypothetical protein
MNWAFSSLSFSKEWAFKYSYVLARINLLDESTNGRRHRQYFFILSQ